jgi:23S rRNA (cytidine2498-2'-O)-methyltransferase
MPTFDNVVVDLGASPGGWTFAILLHCEPRKIIAVDRAKLDPRLMNHPQVEFVQGDAFTFRPSQQVDWMMSDIIAYPERIVELLESWCSNRLATRMVVTVKFQGDTPSWEAMKQAMHVANAHNYRARAKHFFNNKNEVTLMLQHEDTAVTIDEGMNDKIRRPIYERAWPKDKQIWAYYCLSKVKRN